jgi:hypothetical protein
MSEEGTVNSNVEPVEPVQPEKPLATVVVGPRKFVPATSLAALATALGVPVKGVNADGDLVLKAPPELTDRQKHRTARRMTRRFMRLVGTLPHQNTREQTRRLRQISRGQLSGRCGPRLRANFVSPAAQAAGDDLRLSALGLEAPVRIITAR